MRKATNLDSTNLTAASENYRRRSGRLSNWSATQLLENGLKQMAQLSLSRKLPPAASAAVSLARFGRNAVIGRSPLTAGASAANLRACRNESDISSSAL